MAELRYPAEIIADTTDWFRIQAYTYVATAGNIGIGQTSNLTSSGIGELQGSVILPMPSNIQDGNSVSYGEDKLNSLTAQGLNAITPAMNIDLFGDNTAAFTQIQTAVKGLVTGSTLEIIKKSLAAEAVSIFGGNVSIDQLLSRESGQIMNPNMELLFNGVTLRTFRFSFKMTPRDNNESDNIKEIIRFLKQKMAARSGGDFLSAPHVFDLSYRKGGAKHPFLHSFKPCFLKDMSVNYTGENVYATYSDGTPVSMVMDLTFQETEPIYESNYTDDLLGVGY